MGYDLKDIADYYSKKSDSELVQIATEKASGLREGVLEIIESEIQKRQLNPNLISGAIAQNRRYSLDEITKLATILQNLPCPLCRNKTAKLNATFMFTAKSFILFSVFRKEAIVGCPACLNKKNQEAINSNLLLGWWGLPEGLLKTPLYIYYNIKAKRQNNAVQPTEALLNFTLENVGQIETYKDDVEKLLKIIKFVKK